LNSDNCAPLFILKKSLLLKIKKKLFALNNLSKKIGLNCEMTFE
jgi:hypothetical protein